MKEGGRSWAEEVKARRQEFFAPIDGYFADTMMGILQSNDVLGWVGAALASRGVQLGHVCVDLSAPDSVLLRENGADPLGEAPPDGVDWGAHLVEIGLSRWGGTTASPLVSRGHYLYLDRYWHYEDQVRRWVSERQTVLFDDIDMDLLAQGLVRMFGDDVADNEQAYAAALAVLKPFSVIAGGPGTGKTRIVGRILVLLQEQARERQDGSFPLKVQLLAPTGKAAARLTASLRDQSDSIECDGEILDTLGLEATTVHRGLGVRRGSASQFRHGLNDKLVADVVVVDEASMMSVALLAKLMAALGDGARLLLVGDADQLSAVEAGSSFSDISRDVGSGAGRSEALIAQLKSVTHWGDLVSGAHERDGSVRDCIAYLTKVYRFSGAGPIDQLAQGVRDGRQDLVHEALEILPVEAPHWDPQQEGVFFVPTTSIQEVYAWFTPIVHQTFGQISSTPDPAHIVEMLQSIGLLCGHRRGPFGVEGVNQYVSGLLGMGQRSIRHGVPFLVTKNAPRLGLFNGDSGVFLEGVQNHEEVMACIPGISSGELRIIHPSQLPPFELTYGMTVHKSQGSEFDHVVLLLPPVESPILSRELIYTAVTRAKRSVTILGDIASLNRGIDVGTQQLSGLGDGLWNIAKSG